MTRIDEIGTRASGREKDVADIAERKLQILLNEGARTPMDFEWRKPELPAFFDREKFHLGQQAFYDNVFTMMIAKLSGLLSLLAVPTILDVIIFTKQSGTPCTAFRRYVSTIFHTHVWYKRKPIEEDDFLNSLKIVRKKHCVAFRRSWASGINRATQMDMALAQFGFIGFTLLSGDYLGINTTREQLEGLVHFWRVIGSMLGLEDKYNLCSGDVEETRALCRRVLDHVFLPSLAKRIEAFDKMCRALIDGLWPMNPFLDTDAFIAFTLHLAAVSATNNNHSIVIDTSAMPLQSRCILNTQLFVHKYLMPTTYWWSGIFRSFFNTTMRLSIFLTEKFPFLAYWSFGIKHSHVEIFKYRFNG
ncbi:hypothetical protein KM043_009740 [Ampulex compressa]|nr:hypothetical protein KM043_009740 [Ampulex compressa]